MTSICELIERADSGDASAQFNMGVRYSFGKGVPLDNEKAVYWYRKSAEQGHAESQYDLGWMYYRGEGVSQDKEKAVYWFRKSADQGDALAQEMLEEIQGMGK